MPDALRLALGTFTVLRVPPPRRVDRDIAGGAMLLAPYVGALLALVAAAVLLVVRSSPLGTSAPVAADLLGAVLAVASLAWLTRGLHLDGLADVADAAGVRGADDDALRARRLEVMRRPDVGAFGVTTLVLVLVTQVAALTACAVAGRGTVALLLVGLVPRLAVVWACTPRVPAARPDGLGAAVAGSVGVVAALATSAVVVLALVSVGLLDGDVATSAALSASGIVVDLLVAAAVGLGAGAVVVRRCVRQLGGTTGDVLGAVLELSATASLVALALLC